jgi:hypothetical protein
MIEIGTVAQLATDVISVFVERRTTKEKVYKIYGKRLDWVSVISLHHKPVLIVESITTGNKFCTTQTNLNLPLLALILR